MTTDEEPAATGREADLDLYAIGADIPDGKAVLLVTEIDLPDGIFVGRWTTEEEVSTVPDGYLFIRLRRADDATVDTEVILAHDGQLMPVVRLLGVEDWAEQARTPAAFAMSIHTDLESGEMCKSFADGAAR